MHDAAPLSPTRRYARFLRPRLAELLEAVGLDVSYEHAEGDHLVYRDGAREVRVLDLLGGYGASLFGHNHPALVGALRGALDAKRPFNAQASVRGLAARLGERLSEIVGERTGRSYVVTLASSGAEAVEAAIKHAELELSLRADAELDALKRAIRLARRDLQEHAAFVPRGLFDEAAERLSLPQVRDLDELFLHLFRHAVQALEDAPSFLALKGSFHGKTSGALQLTHNPEYRSPWRRIGVRGVFLDPRDDGAVRRAVERATRRFLGLGRTKDGALALEERRFVDVSACFAEPIQGEGGIREVPADVLGALRRAADEGGFPLVLDEIQSGMGRTGTFLASEPSGVRGDYYTLSKSLGGGLCKLAALLVDRERYIADYGYLHTSTFAEDDLSSAVGLEALDLVTREDGALMRRAAALGDRARERLEALRARHPHAIREVRGRGLLLGVELAAPVSSPAPLLRILARQGLLGFAVAGMLLRRSGVRVAPTLSAHGTIRMQPSALIAEEDLDRAIDAFEPVLEAIEANDSLPFARILAGGDANDAHEGGVAASSPPPLARVFAEVPAAATKVVFLGHFLEPGELRALDPTLSPLGDAACARLLDRARAIVEPFEVARQNLRSAQGEEVHLIVYGLPFTSEQVVEGFRSGDVGFALRLIDQSLERARLEGASVVGCGGYTSIVTDNCRTLVDDRIAITSGNALTAAAALAALEEELARVGLERPPIGVLGATGNIGAVLAQVAADTHPEVVLVGRAGAERRLQRAAEAIYADAWVRFERDGHREGVAGAIARTEAAERMRRDGAGLPGAFLREALDAERGERAPVRIACALEALRGCRAIVSATNAARPIVLAEHLPEDGPVVICDIATPRDVHPEVEAKRPEASVLKGGVVHAPLGQTLRLPGMTLSEGQLFGCLAETLVLGLSRYGDRFSYGTLRPDQVRRIAALARSHGFSFGAVRR